MESPIRLSIIYYSTYGINHRMAEVAKDAAEAAGAEVRLRKVRETAPAEVVAGQAPWKAQQERTAHVETATNDDLEWADAYLFSAPTRYGSVASQMRSFFDGTGPLWGTGKLANKVASAMTSARNAHGGQETTLLNFMVMFCHWGSVILPPGYTDAAVFGAGGNPYGTSATTGDDGQTPGVTPEVEAAIRHQTRRMVEMAARLKVQPEPDLA